MAQNRQRLFLTRMDQRNVSIIAAIAAAFCTLACVILGFDLLLGIAWAAAMISIFVFWGSAFWVLNHPESYPWNVSIPQKARGQLAGSTLLSAVVVLLARSGIFTMPPAIFALLQLAILAFTIVGTLMLAGASHHIVEHQQAVGQEVSVIRKLESGLLITASQAKGETAARIKRLAEEIRYSDPMDDQSLSDLERRLVEKTEALRREVVQQHNEEAARLIEEIHLLVQERNQRCLAGK